MTKKMENEEKEMLSTVKNDLINVEKVIHSTKTKKKFSFKEYLDIGNILIVLGIIVLYAFLFLTRYYILSPIEIDKHYKNVYPRDKGLIYIPIVGTNDFHGHFFPVTNKIKLNSTKIISYQTGGVELIYSYINILREEFGENKVLYFNGGDQYYGAQDSKIFNGDNLDDFFDFVGLNGTTLGNKDYLYSREWIEKKIKNANYPFLINNLKKKKNEKKTGILGENQETSHLYEIRLKKGESIKIGVIGITIKKGEDKPFYDIGNRYTWDNIIFQKYETDLENEVQNLKELGANAIILLTSIGLNCNEYENETSFLNMYDWKIRQKSCSNESLIYKLINNIKPGLIDGIIAGDTHYNVHHWVKDIPIMSTKTKSRYINIMYLPFKRITKNKYILIKEKIKIEGPLPLCQKVFQNLKHCEKLTRKEYDKAGELVEYYWHNRRIEIEPAFQNEFEEYYEEFQKYVDEIIVKITGYEAKLKIDKSGNSILGNLILDAIRNISKSDVSIANPGMIRNEILPGTISHIDIVNMFNQEEKLCITEVTGDELITIIKNVQIGENAFQPSSGLRQIIKVKKNGKKEVVDVQLYNNGMNLIKINLNMTYILASTSFILSLDSGEDFQKEDVLSIIQEKYRTNKVKCEQVELGKLLVDYFSQKEEINITKEIELNFPRIIVQKE